MSGRKYIGPWSSQPVGSLADVSLHAQHATIGTTGLTGGNVAKGLYRVSVQISVQVAGPTGSGANTGLAQISAKGENATVNTYSLPSCDFGSLDIQAANFVVSADGTTDISYGVTMTAGTVGSLAYSLRVTLEQLSNAA